MSTKSHVLLNSETEIFEETIEAVYSFGKFKGYNVHAIFDSNIVESLKINGDYAVLEFKKDSQTASDLLPVMKFWLNDLISVEFEYDEIEIVFKGDGLFTGGWSKKMFKVFAPDYKYDYRDLNEKI